MAVRIVNIVGASIFVVYGIAIGAWSVWILNGVLVVIHIIYLSTTGKKKTTKSTRLKRERFKAKSLRENTWFVTASTDDFTL